MKRLALIIALLLSASNASACNNAHAYLKIGAGYKFDEQNRVHWQGQDYRIKSPDPLSARIELGIQKNNWSYGIAHHSQWRSGAPFNDQGEPYKTEVFIDYTFYWQL